MYSNNIYIYIPPSPQPRIIAIQPKRKRSSVAAENANNNNNNNNKRDGKPLAATRVQKPICTRRTRQSCSPYFLYFFCLTTHPLLVLTRVHNNILIYTFSFAYIILLLLRRRVFLYFHRRHTLFHDTNRVSSYHSLVIAGAGAVWLLCSRLPIPSHDCIIINRIVLAPPKPIRTRTLIEIRVLVIRYIYVYDIIDRYINYTVRYTAQCIHGTIAKPPNL